MQKTGSMAKYTVEHILTTILGDNEIPNNSVVFLSVSVFLFFFLGGWGGYWWGRGWGTYPCF